MSKIVTHLASLSKKKREKTQVTSIGNEQGTVIKDHSDIKKVIKEYYKQLCTQKFDNSDEIDQFLK